MPAFASRPAAPPPAAGRRRRPALALVMALMVGLVGGVWPVTAVRYAPTEGPGALKAQPDGALRPCVEDLLGAAAVIDGLTLADVPLSVESAVALAALAAVPDPPAAVWGCVSGRELVERGYADDVALAVQIDASRTVPVLRAGAFTPA